MVDVQISTDGYYHLARVDEMPVNDFNYFYGIPQLPYIINYSSNRCDPYCDICKSDYLHNYKTKLRTINITYADENHKYTLHQDWINVLKKWIRKIKIHRHLNINGNINLKIYKNVVIKFHTMFGCYDIIDQDNHYNCRFKNSGLFKDNLQILFQVYKKIKVVCNIVPFNVWLIIFYRMLNCLSKVNMISYAADIDENFDFGNSIYFCTERNKLEFIEDNAIYKSTMGSDETISLELDKNIARDNSGEFVWFQTKGKFINVSDFSQITRDKCKDISFKKSEQLWQLYDEGDLKKMLPLLDEYKTIVWEYRRILTEITRHKTKPLDKIVNKSPILYSFTIYKNLDKIFLKAIISVIFTYATSYFAKKEKLPC